MRWRILLRLPGHVPPAVNPDRPDLPPHTGTPAPAEAAQVVNQITVDPETEADALVALQRMLDLPGKSHRD